MESDINRVVALRTKGHTNFVEVRILDYDIQFVDTDRLNFSYSTKISNLSIDGMLDYISFLVSTLQTMSYC